jgi:hypothetical protein
MTEAQNQPPLSPEERRAHLQNELSYSGILLAREIVLKMVDKSNISKIFEQHQRTDDKGKAVKDDDGNPIQDFIAVQRINQLAYSFAAEWAGRAFNVMRAEDPEEESVIIKPDTVVDFPEQGSGV